MLKFAANLSTVFAEKPFMERFSAAKNYGFSYFEIEFDAYGLDPKLMREEAGGMKCVLMNSFIDTSDGSFGYAALPGLECTFCDSLNKIAPYYFALGMNKLNIIAGLRDTQFREEDQLNIFVRNLQSSADFLENYNMTALIGPLYQEDHPGYFLNSYDLAIKALTDAKMDNVKLLLDIYQLHKITGDVEGNLAKYYPYAGHVQLSQSPGRCEPYSKGGEIDYNFVFEFLRRNNHSDPIGLEYSPSAGLSTEQSLEWMQRFSA